MLVLNDLESSITESRKFLCVDLLTLISNQYYWSNFWKLTHFFTYKHHPNTLVWEIQNKAKKQSTKQTADYRESRKK